MPTIVLGSGEQDGGQELMTGAGELAQGLRVHVLSKNPSTHKLAWLATTSNTSHKVCGCVGG